MKNIAEAELQSQSVAVLYQALPPPTIGGLRKDSKPGGYSDSGADIVFTLMKSGCRVVTPVAAPDPENALDWVFPDTAEGLEAASQAGATLLWANTVLFEGHPIESWCRRLWIVGQLPARQQGHDDKFATNRLLTDHGLSTAPSILVALAGAGGSEAPSVHSLDELDEPALRGLSLPFPLVVKPIRGRGSQGVSKVDDLHTFRAAVRGLIEGGKFGDSVMVERYLSGTELTVTVMPGPDGPSCLAPVRRFNHHDGIAPYNGATAVTANSVALSVGERQAPNVVALERDCRLAADLVGARAPIRIDCRADEAGVYRLFDLNMKPNMTGAGRPGRDDQDSLSALAARAAGWDYARLLHEMLRGAWREQP